MPFLCLTKHLPKEQDICVCSIDEFRLNFSSHHSTQAVQHVCYFIKSVRVFYKSEKQK